MLFLSLLTLLTVPALTDKLLTSSQLTSLGVILPEGAGSVSEECMSSHNYENTELLLIEQGAVDEDYMCAFVAFQISDDKTTPPYVDKAEAADRFELFKTCVEQVNLQNRKPDSTWKSGVNFFCDMTEKEKYPYSHGLRGLGLGAPKGLGQ